MTSNIRQTTVSVLTARGMSAIGSVALCGAGARGILEDILMERRLPACANGDTGHASRSKLEACVPLAGRILYGMIVDGGRVLDEVLVGCEGADSFVIHCHGNPLLIEQVVKLCQAKGAELVDAAAFAFERYSGVCRNTIEAEAKLAMQTSATLLGAKILNAQIDGGLSKWAQDTLANIELLDVGEIQRQAKAILEKSLIARRIIDGVRIVIAGPPNSGKSTLLNCLSGRQEVIVSDTAGTTRDWVSIHCKLGPLAAEFIDTAGLDDVLAGKDAVEQTAQAITKGLLESCDLIIYVTDVTEGSRQEAVGSISSGKTVVFVENKCDLEEAGIQECRNAGMSELKSQASSLKSVRISARENTGIDGLVDAILAALHVDEILIGDAAAFTLRQRRILTGLKDISDKGQAVTQFEQLIHYCNL